jgi:hypothetical protein
MPLTGAAASRLELIAPLLMLSLTGTISESALSFKGPQLEGLLREDTYVVQIYSGAWTPYSATHHQHPPKATTSFNIIHPYLSKTSFITGHQIL